MFIYFLPLWLQTGGRAEGSAGNTNFPLSIWIDNTNPSTLWQIHLLVFLKPPPGPPVSCHGGESERGIKKWCDLYGPVWFAVWIAPLCPTNLPVFRELGAVEGLVVKMVWFGVGFFTVFLHWFVSPEKWVKRYRWTWHRRKSICCTCI